MEGGSLKVGVYVCRSRTNAEVYCHVPAMKRAAWAPRRCGSARLKAPSMYLRTLVTSVEA